MAERVDCVVLDVGQGSGNFYEVYDASDALVHTALVDLGSEHARTDAGLPSAAYIVKKLKTMPGIATLDVVLLSHSDSDHINLIAAVLDEFSPDGVGKPQLIVLYVAYGGQRSKYRKSTAGNVITELQKYVPVDGVDRINKFSANETQYDTSPAKWKSYDAGPLKMRVLIANASKTTVQLTATATGTKRKAPESYTLNTNSIIVVGEYGTPTVTTGDATGITLAMANQTIKALGLTANAFLDTFMVTAPHHGARATTFDILGITDTGLGTDALARQNLTTFVDNLKAKTLSVSAERVKTFRHPSMEVLEFFWPHLQRSSYVDPELTTSRGHWTTAYVIKKLYALASSAERWPKSAGWYTVQTTYDVFTNLYFVADRVGTAPTPGPTAPGIKTPELPIAVPPIPVDWGEDPDTTGTHAPPLGVTWVFRTLASGARSVDRATNRLLVLAAEQGAQRRVDEIRRLARLPRRSPTPELLSARRSAPSRPLVGGALRGLKVIR